MTTQELNQVLNAMPLLKPDEMEIQDQLKYLSAMNQFAEQIKPLVVKYANKIPKGSNFLLKL